MSWNDELYKLYDKIMCDYPDTILPISHSITAAQIEVTLDSNSRFLSAKIVPKEDSATIIPVTLQSMARSNNIAPHPLADKLCYAGGDFSNCCHDDCKNEKHEKCFEAYINNLKLWVNSENSHKFVNIIYDYLRKCTLVQDLINFGIIPTDDSGKLIDGAKIGVYLLRDVLVRFVIVCENNQAVKTWEDKTLQDSYIAYYSTFLQDEGLCYATGEVMPTTSVHPNKLTSGNDSRKLLSSNDIHGFTFLGRFASASESCSVSYEWSQKAHNALKWLIKNKGITIGMSMNLIVWENSLQELPIITKLSDALTAGSDLDDLPLDYDVYCSRLQKALDGFPKINDNSKSMILALDSTGPGRMAIVYYHEIATFELLQRLKKWYEDTAWWRFDVDKKVAFVTSVSFLKIINLAYGDERGQYVNATPEVLREQTCRLLDCIIMGCRLPSDIVNILIKRSSNPASYKNHYNWQKTLEVTCAILRKKKLDSNIACYMTLDNNCTDRSYLYGRLWAVASAIEFTLNKNKKITDTYFNAFCNNPYTTWGKVYLRIRLLLDNFLVQADYRQNTSVFYHNVINYYDNIITDITSMFSHNDFVDNSKLNPDYLIAYNLQGQANYHNFGNDGNDAFVENH